MPAVENKMATDKLSILVFRYSLPTIIGMLVNSLYNTVDRLWVARIPDIGSVALAGIGICFPVMNIIMAFCQLIGIGAAACISIRLGQKDQDGADRITGNALSLIVILSIAFMIPGLIFTAPMMRLLGASDDLLPYALPYIRIIIGGCIFQMVSFAMNHPIRATGNPMRFAATQLTGGIVNIILDPIFIFVLGMGIRGAAIATVISQAVSAVMVIMYYVSPKAKLTVKRAYLKPHPDSVKAILAIGTAPFLMQIANSITTAVINWSLIHYGDREFGEGGGALAVSAMTIISSVAMLFLMPLFGINQGTQPIIGYNYGARNMTRVKQAYWWAVVYAVIFTSIGFIAVEAGAPLWIRLFNDDPLLVSMGSRALRIFMCMLPFVGFQVPSTNFFMAIGSAGKSIFLSLLRQVIVLIPACFLFPLFLGFDGILWAGPFSDLVSSVATCVLIIWTLKWLDTVLPLEKNGDNAHVNKN